MASIYTLAEGSLCSPRVPVSLCRYLCPPPIPSCTVMAPATIPLHSPMCVSGCPPTSNPSSSCPRSDAFCPFLLPGGEAQPSPGPLLCPRALLQTHTGPGPAPDWLPHLGGALLGGIWHSSVPLWIPKPFPPGVLLLASPIRQNKE